MHPLPVLLRPRPRLGRSGYTLIEVVIAMIVIVVAMLGAVGTVTQVANLGESNRESTLAYQAARAAVEVLHATNFDDVVATFNTDPNDDPDGNGTAPGRDFAVAGLNPLQADADGLSGRILLPLNAAGQLVENLNDPALGMPRDLNGDGAIDGADHRDDCILIPVRVQVSWTGQAGDRTVDYTTTLGRRE